MAPGTQSVVGQAWDIAVQDRWLSVLGDPHRVPGRFGRGVTLWLLDCPYALALAIWYGLISQFLPMIGTYVGGGAAPAHSPDPQPR